MSPDVEAFFQRWLEEAGGAVSFSHIRRIAEIARMHGMRVHAVLPRGSRSGFLEYTLRHSGVDDFVEAA